MAFKLGSMLLVALIALVALVGCDTARDMVMDTMSATDTEMDDMMGTMLSTDTEMDDMMDMMPPMDTEMMADAAPDMEAIPVKLVWLINYPVGGKADYIAWIATVAPTLQAPEELKRVASYDNVRGENPHRLVEFEFDSFADAATYLNRPDIAEVSQQSLPDHSSEASTHVFIQRSDYSKSEDSTRMALVYL